MPVGTEIVEQNGMNGCRSITYKILRLNGQQVSSTVLSTDTYDPMNKIIRRGVAPGGTSSPEPEPEPVPVPVPTPEPEPAPEPAPAPEPEPAPAPEPEPQPEPENTEP